MMGQIAAALWQLAADAFIVLTILGVRKARARGKRLFADGPKERSEALHQSPVDRSQDGWY